MQHFRLASASAFAMLCSTMTVQAAPSTKGQTYDFTFGPRLFLQKNSNTSNKEDISMDGAKALALNNPTDKKEIAQKRMVIVGKEGDYLLGFHVYWEETPNPFPWPRNTVYFQAHYPQGNLGGDIAMPDKNPIGVLNSPWIKTGENVKRTSVRQKFKLKPGTNLITLDIDTRKDFNEFEMDKTGKLIKKLEDNNSVTFAVELVTEIKRPDIKLPR